MNKIQVDEYYIAINCYKTAMAIREKLEQGEKAVAFNLALDNVTVFALTVVDIDKCLPVGVSFKANRMFRDSIQINIEQIGSFAIQKGAGAMDEEYLMEKWHVQRGDALLLLPFFNTILTGRDHYLKKSLDKSSLSNKQYREEIHEDNYTTNPMGRPR